MTPEQEKQKAANEHATAQWKEHPEERNASFENWQNCQDDFIAGAEWEANRVKWIPGLPNDQEIYQFHIIYQALDTTGVDEWVAAEEIIIAMMDDEGGLRYPSGEPTGWEAKEVVQHYQPAAVPPKSGSK
ncbi:hypothetical protein AAHN97_15065 [Chitinophaga niabensis]|uniref:hypothetical protein n=1 Tax=Chitinophaga niabensis TaxID=536979 RepID=UPI0031BB6E8C